MYNWTKNRNSVQPNASSQPPPVQMYNPNQHPIQKNQWQQAPPTQNWYAQQPPQQNQAQVTNYWQQSNYGNPLQQPPPISNNSNNSNNTYSNSIPYQGSGQADYYQQQQKQQPALGYDQQQVYGNLQYSQQQQFQQNQNNIYPPTQANQAVAGTAAPENEGDAWNWNWGDEDNSNVRNSTQNVPVTSANATNIAESFTNEESWNWSLDAAESNVVEPNPTPHDQHNKPAERPPDAHPKPVVRGRFETPQWSTESQVSQESSDDVLHTSESDKSHLVSRSSTISHSPISGQDLVPHLQQQLQSEILHEESVGGFENNEILNNVAPEVEDAASKVVAKVTSPPPLLSKPGGSSRTTPPLAVPPMGTGSEDTNKNPYKRSVGLPYKAATFKPPTLVQNDSRPQQVFTPPTFQQQQVNLETVPDNSEHPDNVVTNSSGSSSSGAVKRLQQWPENNEAPINDRNQYLETGQLSETSSGYTQNDGRQESNDTLPPPGLQRMIPGQFEQNEVNSNFRDNPPPAGLSRMVLGSTETVPDIPVQQQQEDHRLEFDSSGPPEGLRRMVPGESSSPENSLIVQQNTLESNDSEIDFTTQVQQESRSETIGADTPPIDQNVVDPLTAAGFQQVASGNRSETIGGDISLEPNPTTLSQDNPVHIRGSSISSTDNRNSQNRSGGSSSKLERKEKPSVEQSNGRRDYIEGQGTKAEIANVTSSMRNLAVGENLTDGQMSNTSLPEHSPRRRHSRQESSDTDTDRKKQSRSARDKRSMEKLSKSRDKEQDNRYRDRDRDRMRVRERYSPEPARERKDRSRYVYDDESDYYSDKENDRRVGRDERDYDNKKYGSLRKEKDRARKRSDRDVREREYAPKNSEKDRNRRGDFYYSRFDDEGRSRPSSRSDSMREAYSRDRRYERDPRERKHRDRERYRQQADSYNPYQNFGYDPYNPYYQQYQYYENLRRTNPQAYAEWYRKYYQQHTAPSSASFAEDRASVHSGRSSANDELAKDSFGRPYDQTDTSQTYTAADQKPVTQTPVHRYTPVKFGTAHLKASITSGKLVQILPNHPLDGQSATVEICNFQSIFENTAHYRELGAFPGPLLKGVTHKKTIIEYCDGKIKGAIYNKHISDVDSYVLMWELLILLIRQNGMVVGTDIAELLLRDKSTSEPLGRPSSVLSSVSSTPGELTHAISETSTNQIVSENTTTGSLQSILKEEEVTNKFREYLLYGSGKEALEWAMKHGLWGHALFLASKLDKRTYANVMMRFANGLPINDPLQTLYQLLSGKIPAAVTCVSDEKWGDWKPHLAMILSNSTQRPELNCKAITTLGDTLMSRGSLYAAQFCYLMAEVGFGKYDNPESKLVLLGASQKSAYPQYASNESIHMTEVYEYACSLNNQDFIIPEFQIYKYILATRLSDVGLLEKSLQYIEKVAIYITNNPTSVSVNFVDHVYNLADKLKFYDPVGEVQEDESEFGSLLETNRPDTSWLKDLGSVRNDFQSGYITTSQDQGVGNAELYQPQREFDLDQTLQQQQQNYNSTSQDVWQPQQQQQQVWQNESQLQPTSMEFQQPSVELQQPPQMNDFSSNHYPEPQPLWSSQQQPSWNDQQQNQYSQDTSVDQYSNLYDGSIIAQSEPKKEVQSPNDEDNFSPSQPQISLPNQSNSSDEPQATETGSERVTQKDSPQKQNKSPKQEKVQSTGWFGGIFSKLSMRPKNQMILPDDKNPKILWDQDKKRWTNVDEDPSDPANEFKPPPKMTDIMPKLSQNIGGMPPGVTSQLPPPGVTQRGPTPIQSQLQPSSSLNQNENGMTVPGRLNQTNMFKLQRGRNLKNSYIDVFNPGGKTSVNSGPTSLPALDQMPSSMSTPQMNFFIPQVVNDPNAPTDFLTPAPPMPLPEPQ